MSSQPEQAPQPVATWRRPVVTVLLGVVVSIAAFAALFADDIAPPSFVSAYLDQGRRIQELEVALQTERARHTVLEARAHAEAELRGAVEEDRKRAELRASTVDEEVRRLTGLVALQRSLRQQAEEAHVEAEAELANAQKAFDRNASRCDPRWSVALLINADERAVTFQMFADNRWENVTLRSWQPLWLVKREPSIRIRLPSMLHSSGWVESIVPALTLCGWSAARSGGQDPPLVTLRRDARSGTASVRMEG